MPGVSTTFWWSRSRGCHNGAHHNRQEIYSPTATPGDDRLQDEPTHGQLSGTKSDRRMASAYLIQSIIHQNLDRKMLLYTIENDLISAAAPPFKQDVIRRACHMKQLRTHLRCFISSKNDLLVIIYIHLRNRHLIHVSLYSCCFPCTMLDPWAP